MKFNKVLTGIVMMFLLVITIFSATADKPENLPGMPDKPEKPTNLGKIDKENMLYKVEYTEEISSEVDSKELKKQITGTYNTVKIDSKKYPELNKPATVTFKNFCAKNPVILYNGKVDWNIKPKQKGLCSWEIDVKHWSEYTITDTTWNGTFYNTSVYSDGLGLSPNAVYIATFDDNVSEIRDYSYYKNTANTFTPSFDSTDCKYGNSCLFFGTNESGDTVVDIDYVKLDNGNLNPSANFTWCAWYKPTPSSGNNRIIHSFTGDSGFQLFHVSAYNRVYVYNESGNSHVLQKISSSENVWNHMCFVLLDDNNATLFYNGNPEDNADVGTYKPSGNDYLTFGTTSNNQRYDGNVQCVQMWDTPLNPSQIADVNNSATCDDTLHSPSHTWKLNEYKKTQEDSVGDDDGDMGAFYTNESQFGTGAFEFDGVDDYINVGDISEFDSINDTFTMSLWIKINDVNSEQIFIDRFKSGGYSFRFHQIAGHLRLRVSPDGTYVPDYVQELNVLNDGELAHITVTFDKGSVTFYKNGTELNTHDIGHTHIYKSDLDVIIGGGSTNSRYFNGIMDEVKVFDRTLSESEITELYDSNPMSTYYSTGHYLSEIYNSSDYDTNIETNKWLATILKNSTGIDNVEGRAGKCSDPPPESWYSGTLEGNNWTFPAIQGECFQFKAYLSGDTENLITYENVTIKAFKVKKPTMEDVTVNTSSAITTDFVQGIATFMLNDIDTGDVLFEWYVNGINVYNDSSNTDVSNNTVVSSLLNSAYTNKGDYVNFTVTPTTTTDYGDSEGETVWSNNTLEISNANFTFTSTPTDENVTIQEPRDQSFEVDITDVDGDVIISWYLDGNKVDDDDTYRFIGGYDTQGNYTVFVEMTDGEYTQNETWNMGVSDRDVDWELVGITAVTSFVFVMLLAFFFLGQRAEKEYSPLRILLFGLLPYILIIVVRYAQVLVEASGSVALQNLFNSLYLISIVLAVIITFYLILYLLWQIIKFYQFKRGKFEQW